MKQCVLYQWFSPEWRGGEHVTVSEGVLTYHNSHGSTGIYWKARDTDAKHPTLQEIVPYRKELPSPNC